MLIIFVLNVENMFDHLNSSILKLHITKKCINTSCAFL